MKPFSATVRSDNVARLGTEQFDVLVVGGGITGAGVALDAAARGYRVALVEKADFSSGTSSRSTKLVHGGIRYLPQFDFALVHEALVERGIMRQNAPYLVRPLPFVLPLYQGAQRPVGIPFTPPGARAMSAVMATGLWMYDFMAGRRHMARHRHISPQRALALAPALRPQGLHDAFIYTDGVTNDTRLTMTVLRTADQHGATVVNYAGVSGFTRDANGMLNGATVFDQLANETLTVRARHIINAAGVFAERVQSLTGDPSHVSIEPSKGVHLVVRRERLRLGETAIVLPETDDRRILFVNPWGPRAIIGTTDTGRGDLDDPQTTEADIDYLLRHVNRYLDVDLRPSDLISSYAGYRPLVRATGKSTANLSRTHVIVREQNGMVTIVGGKLTTYRRMAQDTVDVIAGRDGMSVSHPTKQLLLDGAVGWKRASVQLEERARALDLSPEVTDHLAWSFGRNALTLLDLIERDPSLRTRLDSELPYLRAEVVFACRHEMAMHLDDVMSRRTRLAIEANGRGSEQAQDVAAIMASELGWTAEQRDREVEAYRASISHQINAETSPVGGDRALASMGQVRESEGE